MAKLTMTKGLQGSGKSTWATAQGCDVVTKDDIRQSLNKKTWNYDVEREVLRIRDFQVAQALSKGKDVISADTNLAPKHEAQLRKIAEKYGATFEVRDFTDVPLLTCIERDKSRENPIGEKIIRDTAEQYFGQAYLVPGAATPQVFVDLDGVLADFDGFIEKEFGIAGNRENERPDFWDIVRGYTGRLYFDMDPLPGAEDLWRALLPYNPIILTGIPWSIPTAVQDKRDWVAKYIDPLARVIPCRSRSKSRYGKPGDILIDDWTKYQQLWQDMGGVWFTYKGDWKATVKAVRAALDK